MTKQKRALSSVMIVSLFFAGIVQAEENRRQNGIPEILRSFPAKNSEELDRLTTRILGLGEEGILSICQTLAPPGRADDSRARYALGGLTTCVSRPGVEKKRAVVAKALIKALNLAAEREVKAFLIRLLQRCGGSESVRPLKKYLTVNKLCEPAAQALLAIGSFRAEKALFRSLSYVAAQNRVTIVKALGELKSRRSVRKVLGYAESPDSNLRSVALFTLANIGDTRAEEALRLYRVAASPYERAQAPSLYLLYARRIGESGERMRSAKICRDMIRSYISPGETHIPCAALSMLVEFLGREALPDLLEAMGCPHKAVRIKALSLAEAFPGPEMTASWIKISETLPPEVRAEVVGMLGRRGDGSALPSVLDALNSEEPVLCAAAVEASVRLGGHSVIERLWTLLEKDSVEVIEAVKKALLDFPAHLVVPRAAGQIERSSLPAQMALIDILAESRAKESAEIVFDQTDKGIQELRLKALRALEFLVREQDLPRLVEMLIKTNDNHEIIALQNAIVAGCVQIEDPGRRADPILTVLETAETKKKIDLIRVFPRLGGEKVLQALTALAESEDARIQTAAIYGLSRWPEFEAVNALRNIIMTTENSTHRYVCLQGFVRLIEEAGISPQERFSLIEETAEAAVEMQDKKVILKGMAGIQSRDSLKWVVPYLGDPEVALEAARAVIRIALPKGGEELGLTGEETEEDLKLAADILDDVYTHQRVQDYMEFLWRMEGFVPLFNGNDLSGWIGDKSGYAADEGRIVVSPEKDSGNLYTEKQFSDFILRFEFKLTAGANNGLGIRTPLEGDPAYVGIELQILDNTADVYKNLKPYQYHGSLYGVVPAKRGYLKPVGDWNSQVVTARGRRIAVKLNGNVIMDADIDQLMKMETMDGRDHPGLMREKGHICFLGHGSIVEFRNIWIRELK